MTANLKIPIGTDDATLFKNLKYQDPLIDVPENTITRAMFRFGPYCLDTDDGDGLFVFQANRTQIKAKMGLIPNLEPGEWQGYLTLFDADGKHAWKSYRKVTAEHWPICPVTE